MRRCFGILLLAAVVACTETGSIPGAPVIERITAEADVYSATISFHVSGGLEGVRESGVLFGLDNLDEATGVAGETRVEGGEDPSKHDFIIVSLHNLSPATRYYYKVFIGNGRSQVESDVQTFTTRPASPEGPPSAQQDWIEVPDEAFRDVLVALFDKNLDGGIDADEAGTVTEMDVSGRALTNLSGIELFPNLKKLICSENLIPELDISACPVLNYLDCNPMQDESRQTVLKTIWIRLDQPIEYIDKPEKSIIRIRY